MSVKMLKKLARAYIWKRLLYERLSEPLHLNLMAIFVFLFGTYRQRIEFDLVLRQNHAYALLDVADQAKSLGYERLSIFEFGVAAGAGLVNLQEIARRITRLTGVEFDIYGFDTGAGMPPPKSYKDHPEYYQAGDFPTDVARLSALLDGNTKLILGAIADTTSDFLQKDFSRSPIAFISIDVDYYSSAVDALVVLKHRADNLLPRVVLYLDDLEYLGHNSWCGEQAAVNEFTQQNPLRPIEKHAFLRGHRIFKNARWIDHIYQCHVLDHPVRNDLNTHRERVVITNPYL